MKSFWISEVFLLLSVFELVVISDSVSEFSCRKRTLIVTAIDNTTLYINGIKITDLPNARVWDNPDFVELPCTTRLIAIHASTGPGWNTAGILASTDDGYVLTNSTWKCSNVSQFGWADIDFDDSAWMPAIEYGHDGEGIYGPVPNILKDAKWIWLRQKADFSPSSDKVTDPAVFCRKRLASTSQYSTYFIILGVFFGVSVLANIALISTLLFFHLPKKAMRYEDLDEGESGVGNGRHLNDDAARNRPTWTDPAPYEYEA